MTTHYSHHNRLSDEEQWWPSRENLSQSPPRSTYHWCKPWHRYPITALSHSISILAHNNMRLRKYFHSILASSFNTRLSRYCCWCSRSRSISCEKLGATIAAFKKDIVKNCLLYEIVKERCKNLLQMEGIHCTEGITKSIAEGKNDFVTKGRTFFFILGSRDIQWQILVRMRWNFVQYHFQ